MAEAHQNSISPSLLVVITIKHPTATHSLRLLALRICRPHLSEGTFEVRLPSESESAESRAPAPHAWQSLASNLPLCNRKPPSAPQLVPSLSPFTVANFGTRLNAHNTQKGNNATFAPSDNHGPLPLKMLTKRIRYSPLLHHSTARKASCARRITITPIYT